MSSHPFIQLVLARFREFIREPEAVFWAYGFPLLMMIGLGIAFRERPMEQVTVDVEDSTHAQRIMEMLSNDERVVVSLEGTDAARERLRTGKTDLIVVPQSTTECEYVFDVTKSAAVLARNIVDDVLQRQAGRSDPIATKDVAYEQPGGRYIDFLVPGLIGSGLMGGGLWGVGFLTVDLRIRKLLKRYIATPMRKGHFLAALMISRLIFTVPEVIFMLLFARLAFGVVNFGSYLLLISLIVLGAAQFSGLGLLLASRAKTLEAVSGLMNLAMLPMWIFSGIFFSADRFPDAAQPFIACLPLTPLIEAMRSVMLEGSPLTGILPQLGAILGWTGVSFVLALRWFRWK